MSQRVLLCLLALGALAGSAQGATFNVDSSLDLVDDSPGDGLCRAAAAGNPCTLRAAVMEANANSDADVVRLPAGINIGLSLTGEGGTEIGDLNISTPIEIIGFDDEPPVDATQLPRIDASALADRHFSVVNGQLRLRGLRLEGGVASTGGALRVSGNASSAVEIEHVLLVGNRAESRGGAIYVTGSASVRVQDSHIFQNLGGAGGGAAVAALLDSSVTLRRSSLADNRGANGVGTLLAQGDARLRIEDSTLDGTPQGPPIAGFAAGMGVQTFQRVQLVIRGSTLTGFAIRAVSLSDIDGDERVVIANSVLQSSGTACVASGDDLAAGNVQIAHSRSQSTTGCEGFYDESVRSGIAELGALVSDAPRLTQSRPPAGPLSNVVDLGSAPDLPSSDPDLACTATDQRGNPRPLDGNLDDDARCDVGAIEEAAPEAFVVTHFSSDLTDDLPGDGVCASVDQPGIGVVCTLRAAVMEANALPGLDYIRFAPSSIPVQLTLPPAGPVGGTLRITEALAIEGNLVDGRPATSVEGDMTDQGLFSVDADGEAVHFRNLALSGGDATAAGGALHVAAGQVTLRRSELGDNASLLGGGAVAVTGGVLSVIDSAFAGNASDAGAAAFVSDGYLSISGSSFHGHLGFRADGSPVPTIETTPGARLHVANSTLSDNQQAIWSDRPDLLLLQFVTLADHLSGGVNVELQGGSDFMMEGSIISAPTSAQPDCGISGLDLAGETAFDHLLDSDGTCAVLTANSQTAPALLRPLERPHGRISFQRAPNLTETSISPAIDRAVDSSCSNRSDQYGRWRPQDLADVTNAGGACDLGAIEVAAAELFIDGFESTP